LTGYICHDVDDRRRALPVGTRDAHLRGDASSTGNEELHLSAPELLSSVSDRVNDRIEGFTVDRAEHSIDADIVEAVQVGILEERSGSFVAEDDTIVTDDEYAVRDRVQHGAGSRRRVQEFVPLTSIRDRVGYERRQSIPLVTESLFYQVVGDVGGDRVAGGLLGTVRGKQDERKRRRDRADDL